MSLQNKDIYAEADPFFLLCTTMAKTVSLLIWNCIGLLADLPAPLSLLATILGTPMELTGLKLHEFPSPFREVAKSAYFIPLYHISLDPWLLSKDPLLFLYSSIPCACSSAYRQASLISPLHRCSVWPESTWFATAQPSVMFKYHMNSKRDKQNAWRKEKASLNIRKIVKHTKRKTARSTHFYNSIFTLHVRKGKKM